MSEMSAGVQSYWLALGTLLVLCGILAAVMWYSRKILSTLRASQEQVGALLKLSISDAIPEKTVPSGISFERAAVLHSLTGVPQRAPLPGLTVALLPETESVGIGSTAAGFARSTIRWLRAPIRQSKGEPSGRLMRWLQASVRG